MVAKKWHIGVNGPALCTATKIACRYEDKPHGTERAISKIWEANLESEFGADEKEQKKMLQEYKATRTRRKFFSEDYTAEEIRVAMNLAAEFNTDLDMKVFKRFDRKWLSDGGNSTVERVHFEDGTNAYFKPLMDNNAREDDFSDYWSSSATAMANEVNAYRLAQAMGDEFAALVPETTIRAVNGNVGSVQAEAKGVRVFDHDSVEQWVKNKSLREDARRAMIFDFVLSNIDRHPDNYMVVNEVTIVKGEEKSRRRIKLIDNSFSFNHEVPDVGSYYLNDFGNPPTIATGVDNSTKFTKDEIKALKNARAAVEGWKADKTMSRDQANQTIERIDYLLKKNTFQELWQFTEENKNKNIAKKMRRLHGAGDDFDGFSSDVDIVDYSDEARLELAAL